MAPLPVIADTFRITINYVDTIGRQLAANVIHVFAPFSNQDDVGNDVGGFLTNEMFEPTSTSILIASIDVIPLDGVTPTKNYLTPGITGGSTGQFIPNTSLVISFKTPIRGPSFRGRAFIALVAEGITADGIFEVSVVQDCLDAWIQFQTDLTGALLAQAVASYKLEVATLVTTYESNQRNDTQRRRLNAVAA